MRHWNYWFFYMEHSGMSFLIRKTQSWGHVNQLKNAIRNICNHRKKKKINWVHRNIRKKFSHLLKGPELVFAYSFLNFIM